MTVPAWELREEPSQLVEDLKLSKITYSDEEHEDQKEDKSYLMTETLARVYLEQKKYSRAIQAYEILILKYPEKSSFFVDRIKDIKIIQQNNN